MLSNSCLMLRHVQARSIISSKRMELLVPFQCEMNSILNKEHEQKRIGQHYSPFHTTVPLSKNATWNQTKHLQSFSTNTRAAAAGTTTTKKQQSKHRKLRGQNSYKFVDRARILCRGGDGGKGCISYKFKGSHKKRPDGGHGGHGARVIIVADPGEQTLNMSKHHYNAESGKNGGSNVRNGRNGNDLIVRVPRGIVVRRVLGLDEEWDEREEMVVKKFVEEEDVDEDDVDVQRHERETVERSGKKEINFDDEEEWKKFMYKYDSDDDDDNDNDDTEDHDNLDTESDKTNSKKQTKNDSIDDDDEEHDLDISNWHRQSDGLYHTDFLEQNDDNIHDNSYDDSSSSWDNTIPYEERTKVTLADLDQPGSYLIASMGGHGGTGNHVFAKGQHIPNVQSLSARKSAGTKGESSYLELELKLIADMGLVGFPNAGKSSLLAAMSMAKPEIAPYPFTTLHPLVGCIEYKDGFRVVAADIPGLIQGASQGRGRGYDFLRHLERTKALLYIVDAAGVDGRNPAEDLRVLAHELNNYRDEETTVLSSNNTLSKRPSIVVCNKLDLIQCSQEREQILFDVAIAAEEVGIQYGEHVFGISAGVTGEGLGSLSKAIREIVVRGEEERLISEADPESYNSR